ncbi:MAG: phage portal protein [Agathobaculum sp.]
MFYFDQTYEDYLLSLGRENTTQRMTDAQFIVQEIHRFWRSKRCRDMVDGDLYYRGKHDILHKKRTAIGENGELITLDNLPNSRIVDNQFRKMVDQKANYLVGQPFVIRSENQEFADALQPYLMTKQFSRLIKAVTRDALCCGIGWLYPYYDDDGSLTFRRLRPYEVIPLWANEEHTRLDAAIRVYDMTEYVGNTEKVVHRVEVYDDTGIHYFTLDGGNLTPIEPFNAPYIMAGDQAYNWEHIPLVAFKCDAEETPLLTRCRSMQDGLNEIESQWQDQMQEDPRNTIMVLVNYDGENLGEFRRNLATYGAVKVRSDSSGGGDVRTLQIEVNAENYQTLVQQFKKAIIENCMGYDAKDDRLGSNANEMNIKSMYSDIELDTNGMETEYQAAFEELIWFITCHIANVGGGDFENEQYELIFNRDILISESSAIADCKNSMGVISNETIVANHPWVDDVQGELDRLAAEKEENLDLYGGFGQNVPPDDKNE